MKTYTIEEAVKMLDVQLKDWLENKTINPWCGLCGSKKFHCETGVTKFRTMQEAMPQVKETEMKQMLTALAWKANPQRN